MGCDDGSGGADAPRGALSESLAEPSHEAGSRLEGVRLDAQELDVMAARVGDEDEGRWTLALDIELHPSDATHRQVQDRPSCPLYEEVTIRERHVRAIGIEREPMLVVGARPCSGLHG